MYFLRRWAHWNFFLLFILVFVAPLSVGVARERGRVNTKKTRNNQRTESVRMTLVQFDKKAYLSAGNLIRIHSDLRLRYSQRAKQGEIRFGMRILLFELGKSHYQVQHEVNELESQGTLYDQGLFFSREFVEEILTELNLPVSYRFNANNLLIQREAKRKTRKMLDFIVIDAGHGGKDSGALGYFDVQEKDITLKLAHALQERLRADFSHVKVYLTRSGDRFYKLETRSRIANRKNKDSAFGLFISIHGNSTLSPKVKGFEVYYLAQSHDNMEARQMMLRESMRYESSAYIRKLKSKLMSAQIQRESKTLARSVFHGMSNRLDGMIKPRKVKKADFAVLRGSLMPAILIETGYLTNRDDLKRLRSEEYQKAFAAGVSRGVSTFLHELTKAER